MENNFDEISNSFNCIFETNSNSSFEESFEIEKDIFMNIKNLETQEINNKNILNKKRKKNLSEEEIQKEKRRKNKEAAKKSREKKRNELKFLYEENIKLKNQIEFFKNFISVNLCENCLNKIKNIQTN